MVEDYSTFCAKQLVFHDRVARNHTDAMYALSNHSIWTGNDLCTVRATTQIYIPYDRNTRIYRGDILGNSQDIIKGFFINLPPQFIENITLKYDNQIVALWKGKTLKADGYYEIFPNSVELGLPLLGLNQTPIIETNEYCIREWNLSITHTPNLKGYSYQFKIGIDGYYLSSGLRRELAIKHPPINNPLNFHGTGWKLRSSADGRYILQNDDTKLIKPKYKLAKPIVKVI